MSILVSLYESRSLTAAINLVKVTEPFVMSKVFSANEPHNTETVDIEIVTGSEKIAQFVAEDDPSPKPIKKLTTTVKTVKIPRTYESKTFSARELADMTVIGSIYPNDADKKKAQNDRIILELADLKQRVYRRREQMSCEALTTGKIIVEQADLHFTVDYGFVAEKQLINLTGDDRWSSPDSDPIGQIRKWKRYIMQNSGSNPAFVLMGSNAADQFIKNSEVMKKFDAMNYRIGALDMSQSADTRATSYIGRILGLDVFEYAQQYINSTGIATDMFDPDTVVMVAPGGTFRMHNGAIYRIQNQNIVPIYGDMLVEINRESNDKFLQWDCEQKSLPAIHDPSCVISAKVLNDA